MITQPETDTLDLLACIDGSVYSDSVCEHAVWAAIRLDTSLRLLHVQASQPSMPQPPDLSGNIGLGARTKLLAELAQMDEERSRIDMRKGRLILEHAKNLVEGQGLKSVDIVHRRGSLVETLGELETTAQMILIGKRGEHADSANLHLGSNLERTVRAARRPVMVCPRTFQPVARFAVAFDGGASTMKAIESVANSRLFRGLECRLLYVGEENASTRAMVNNAATRLDSAGISVETVIRPGNPDTVIPADVAENRVDLMVMGAYGHSRIRTLIIGSTTSAMLRACRIPMIMYR